MQQFPDRRAMRASAFKAGMATQPSYANLSTDSSTVGAQQVRYGATQSDWDHFTLLYLGLTDDVLPVVCNPNAVRSPTSAILKPGKVPTLYNRRRQYHGIVNWTQKRATAIEIDQWVLEPDYGISVQTRFVRAIDVDVIDQDLASQVRAFIEDRVGKRPIRYRPDSAKFLIAFALGGTLAKRVIKTRAGAIELLATGQQFVAVGTHPDGARYKWEGGLPETIPSMDLPTLDQLWSDLSEAFGIDPLERPSASHPATTVRKKGPRLSIPDELADNVKSAGLVLGETRDGGLIVTCPWQSEHTSGAPGDTSTVYFPAGTNGYEHGSFRCMHAHCAGRTKAAFAFASGFGPTADEAFAGLDDHPDATPTNEVTEAVATRGPGRTDTVMTGTIILVRNDYWAAAERLVKVQYCNQQGNTLLRWNGQWWIYQGTHYVEIDKEAMQSAIWRFLSAALTRIVSKPDLTQPFRPKLTDVSSVESALRAVVAVPVENVPSWLPSFDAQGALERRHSAAHLISLQNCLFHVPTGASLPHTLGLFNLNALPFEYAADAICPNWIAFLDSLWNDDFESKEALQEVVGYLLTADTSLQKMFMLIGPKRSGKGTIARVINALLGANNVVGPTLSSLTKDFGLAPLIGKLVATIADARSVAQGAQTIVERLLMISGEDSITVDRKHTSAWTGRITARFLILSNELLQLGDASGALIGRLIVLKLRHSFYGQEDPHLADHLLEELPGIFNWAVGGLIRLKKRGRFVQPAAGLELVSEMEDSNGPVGAFVEDCCELGPNYSAPKEKVFCAWEKHCEATRRHAGNLATFSKNLLAACPTVGSIKPRSAQGPQIACYAGLRLKAGTSPPDLHFGEFD